MRERKSLAHLFVAIFLGLCSTLSFTPTSYAATHSHSSPASSCTVTQVTLHGTADPTIQSVPCTTSKRTSKGNGITPTISTSGSSCPADDLILYYNGPVGASGPILCVSGDGTLNLNHNFNGVWWNDVVSAWWTGCSDTFFYVDINKKGTFAFAEGSNYGLASPAGNFPYNSVPVYGIGSGTVGNDKLSSIALFPSWLC
jgi:hypothetical protein